MSKSAKVLKAFSKIYLGLFSLFAAILICGLILVPIYWGSVLSGSRLGEFLVSIRGEPKFQSLFSTRENIYLLFECGRLGLGFLLNALIFKTLAKFLESRATGDSIKLQSDLLSPAIKYLVALFFIGAIEVLDLVPTSLSTEQWLHSHSIVLGVFDLLIPEFGGPIGLVLAGLIYLFRKSLEDQARLASEASQLRQEAELVI